MSFEERLLTELRAEATRRATARERARHRPLAMAVAGLACAVAAVVVPAFTGSRTATAYALTDNADGSITVTIKDFRNPERLEEDLAVRGARTDITYLPQHMRCGDDRGTSADPQNMPDLPPNSPQEQAWLENLPSAKAFQWPSPRTAPNVFDVYPRHIGPGQTLVLELAESHKTKLWKLRSDLISGPVRPCVFAYDPTWN